MSTPVSIILAFIYVSLGTDATEAFEDVGHSAGAREMLKEYLIGEVTEVEDHKDERASKSASVQPSQYHHSIITW